MPLSRFASARCSLWSASKERSSRHAEDRTCPPLTVDQHRIALSFLALCLLMAVAFAAQKADTSPELFSTVMQRVSAQPEFRERVLEGIREVPKVGEFLSPDLVDRLRVLILGKEWQRVDHFPALTVAALNKSVGAAVRLAGKSATPLQPADLLDTAEYPLGHAETIDLDHPATAPTYADDPATARRDIGFNLTMGDGPDPVLAPMHAESRQLAAVLNRLAMNTAGQPQAVATLDGKRFTDGGALIQELAESGHTGVDHRRCLLRELRPSARPRPRSDDAVLDRHTDRRARQPSIAPAAGQPLRTGAAHTRAEMECRCQLLLRHRWQGPVSHHGLAQPELGDAPRPLLIRGRRASRAECCNC